MRVIVFALRAPDIPVHAIVRAEGARAKPAAALTDDLGRAELILPDTTDVLEAVAIGYSRRLIDVALRPGYTDTLSVGLQFRCEEPPRPQSKPDGA